jgi:negative regulator of sigma E activity
MGRRPESSPRDLFDTPARPVGGQALVRNTGTAPARLLLPSNLESSLAVLSGDEFARLAAGVAAETARRQRTLTRPSKPAPATTAKPPQASKRNRASDTVSPAKANLVRAAIKAGVKPSAIARQFGLSNAAISRVLRSDEK